MSAIEIKQLKDKIEKLTEELWALENEEEEREYTIEKQVCGMGYMSFYDEKDMLEQIVYCKNGSWKLKGDKKARDLEGELCLTDDEEEEEEELTWQEKMKNYDKLVDVAYGMATRTKDEDLVVGDIVKHSFGCRDYKLMRVDRLTEKTIWYSECWTIKHTIRDSGGDFHTYGKFMGIDLVLGLNYKRKRHTKVLSPGDEKWRGQMVYKYPSCGNIWIKEEQSDMWR